MEAYLEHGGIVLKILIGISIVGFTIILFKLFLVLSLFWSTNKHLEIFKSKLASYKNDELGFSEKLNACLDHFMRPKRSGLNTLKVIASVAPLLGLLGTVLGIFNTFSAISGQGMNDPKLFATGISQALITTVAGLLVSIPHFMAYSYFNSSFTKAGLILEESFLTSNDKEEA